MPQKHKQMVKQAKTFNMFGTDYQTKDGTCVRDYIHVDDLTKAHELALHKLLNGGATAYYNLGSGDGYNVREVYNTAKEVTGVNIPLHEAERRPGDPAELIASNKKAKKELGWEPQKTLEDMISSAWKWIMKDEWKKH